MTFHIAESALFTTSLLTAPLLAATLRSRAFYRWRTMFGNVAAANSTVPMLLTAAAPVLRKARSQEAQG
jgi:hypothetical protein